MKNQKRRTFDVPVDGIRERYMSMDELLCAFHSCKVNDHETARAIAEYACACGNIQSKFEYSFFLRTTPELAMAQAERYMIAEKLLLELLNDSDMPSQFSASVALELGTLYSDCLHRPVGALSLYLYAKNLGATVEDYKLKELHKKMEKMDINHLGSNCIDALRLGRELYYSGGPEALIELFLREAVDKASEEMAIGRRGAQRLYGQACLDLGDFYDLKTNNCAAHERTVYRIERDRMYAEARANGNPEYLRKKDLTR